MTPLLLRVPLTVMVPALMTLTAIGRYGFLTRAQLQHQGAAQEAIDRDAAPLAQRIALGEAMYAIWTAGLRSSTRRDREHRYRPWLDENRYGARRRTERLPSYATVAERQQLSGWPT